MVAYSLHPQFHLAVETGAKDLTFRQPNKKRHAVVGEVFGLDLPQGQDAQGRFLPKVTRHGLCVARAQVVIAPWGLVRLLDATETPGPRGEGITRLLRACEQGASQAAAHLPILAARDGFDSWPNLWRWQMDHKASDEPDDLLTREVIGWDLLDDLGPNPLGLQVA